MKVFEKLVLGFFLVLWAWEKLVLLHVLLQFSEKPTFCLVKLMVPIEKLVLLYVLLHLHLKTKVLLSKTNFSIGMDGR